jgi:hypothetical protein
MGRGSAAEGDDRWAAAPVRAAAKLLLSARIRIGELDDGTNEQAEPDEHSGRGENGAAWRELPQAHLHDFGAAEMKNLRRGLQHRAAVLAHDRDGDRERVRPRGRDLAVELRGVRAELVDEPSCRRLGDPNTDISRRRGRFG